jgi:hypothetical protein
MFGLLKRHLMAMLASVLLRNHDPASRHHHPTSLAHTGTSGIGFRERSGNRGIERYVNLARAGAPGDPWRYFRERDTGISGLFWNAFGSSPQL